VWVGIFSLTTIAQFWSYANEIYTRPEGARLFPLIAIGSTAGAPLGAAAAARMFGHGRSPFLMMEIAAAVLLVHLVLYRVIAWALSWRCRSWRSAPTAPPRPAPPSGSCST
jgi:AAA family ATP:ADP antiporter